MGTVEDRLCVLEKQEKLRKSEIIQLRQESFDLKRQNEELRRANRELRTVYADVMRDVKELKLNESRISELECGEQLIKAEIDKLLNENLNLHCQTKELTEVNKTIRTQHSELKDEVHELSTLLQTSDIANHLVNISSEIQKIQQDGKDLRKYCEGNEEQNDIRWKEFYNEKTRIVNLQRSLNHLMIESHENRPEIQNLYVDVTIMKQKMANLQQLHIDVRTMKPKVNDLKELHRDMRVMEQRMNELQDLHIDVRVIQQKMNELQELQIDMRVMKQKMNDMQPLHTNVKSIIKERDGKKASMFYACIRPSNPLETRVWTRLDSCVKVIKSCPHFNIGDCVYTVSQSGLYGLGLYRLGIEDDEDDKMVILKIKMCQEKTDGTKLFIMAGTTTKGIFKGPYMFHLFGLFKGDKVFIEVESQEGRIAVDWLGFYGYLFHPY